MLQRAWLVICALLIVASVAWAQAQSRAEAIAPWITEDTAWVVAARIDDVDLDVVSKWALTALDQFVDPAEVGQAKEATARATVFARGLRDELKAAGVKEIYAIYDGNPHRQEQMLVVFPAGQNAQLVADKLKALIGQRPPVSVDQGAAILHADGRPAERAARAERPELASALASSDAPVIMALTIPQAARDEIPAELPQRMGGGDPTPIRDGFMWACVDLRLVPEPAIRGVAQMDGEENAKGALALVQSVVDATVRRGGGDAQILASISKWLMPTVKGEQLVVDLPANSIRQAFTDLGPAFQTARMQAKRVASASQIRQLAMGVHMFANENKGKTPDRLEDLEKVMGNARNLAWLMKNPQRPEMAPGYIYVKQPDLQTLPNGAANTVIIYESYTNWPGGINVGYADGHVEWVPDEARFLEQLKASGGTK